MAHKSRIIFKSGTDFLVNDRAAKNIADQLGMTASEPGPRVVMAALVDGRGDPAGAIHVDISTIAAVFIAQEED